MNTAQARLLSKKKKKIELMHDNQMPIFTFNYYVYTLSIVLMKAASEQRNVIA